MAKWEQDAEVQRVLDLLQRQMEAQQGQAGGGGAPGAVIDV
jgi:hypothetical protein